MPESPGKKHHKKHHSGHHSHHRKYSGDEHAYMRKRKAQEKESRRRERRMRKRKRQEIRRYKIKNWISRLRQSFSVSNFTHYLEKRKMIMRKKRYYWKVNINERKKRIRNTLRKFSWNNVKGSFRLWIFSIQKDWKGTKARWKERHRMRMVARQEAKAKFRFYLKFYGSVFSSVFNVKGDYFKVLSNSTFFYILSHITIYLIYQLMTILVAHQYKLPTILYYYKTAFPTPPNSPLWTENNIINTFGSAPMLLFLSGVLFYFLYGLAKKRAGMLKVYVLWLYIQSIGYFIGSIIAGTITLKYFGWSLAWMGALAFLPKLALLPFLILLFVIGYQAIKLFIQTSPNYKLIGNLESTRKYLFSAVILPYIIGNAVIFLTKLPELHPYEVLIYFSMTFMIFPFMMNFRDYGQHNIAASKKELTFPVILVISTLLLLIIFRVWLGYGIHFV
jgi:hypothetical protein